MRFLLMHSPFWWLLNVIELPPGSTCVEIYDFEILFRFEIRFSSVIMTPVRIMRKKAVAHAHARRIAVYFTPVRSVTPPTTDLVSLVCVYNEHKSSDAAVLADGRVVHVAVEGERSVALDRHDRHVQHRVAAPVVLFATRLRPTRGGFIFKRFRIGDAHNGCSVP